MSWQEGSTCRHACCRVLFTSCICHATCAKQPQRGRSILNQCGLRQVGAVQLAWLQSGSGGAAQASHIELTLLCLAQQAASPRPRGLPYGHIFSASAPLCTLAACLQDFQGAGQAGRQQRLAGRPASSWSSCLRRSTLGAGCRRTLTGGGVLLSSARLSLGAGPTGCTPAWPAIHLQGCGPFLVMSVASF